MRKLEKYEKKGRNYEKFGVDLQLILCTSYSNILIVEKSFHFYHSCVPFSSYLDKCFTHGTRQKEGYKRDCSC